VAGERCIVIAVEDVTTATTVAVAGARAAVEEGATDVVLLHVLSPHPVLQGMLNLGGPGGEATEPREEAEMVLTLAERALRAQLASDGNAAPAISHLLESGDPATAIARAATGCGAALVVLGARRPHAFGLLHPDVRASIAGRLTCPVRVAPLQARA